MFFWSQTHCFGWLNHDFWMNAKRDLISVQSIMYIFCDAKAGMEFGALCKTAISMLFMPQFGKEYEGSSCIKQTWMSNYQWLNIQVSAKNQRSS